MFQFLFPFGDLPYYFLMKLKLHPELLFHTFSFCSRNKRKFLDPLALRLSINDSTRGKVHLTLHSSLQVHVIRNTFASLLDIHVFLELCYYLSINFNIFILRLLYKNLKIKIYKTILLSVVLYGCETWSLTLREESRLRVFENWILR